MLQNRCFYGPAASSGARELQPGGGGNVEKALLGLLVEEESVGTRFKRSSHTIRGFLRGFVFK